VSGTTSKVIYFQAKGNFKNALFLFSFLLCKKACPKLMVHFLHNFAKEADDLDGRSQNPFMYKNRI
jgi:hypothetical protein